MTEVKLYAGLVVAENGNGSIKAATLVILANNDAEATGNLWNKARKDYPDDEGNNIRIVKVLAIPDEMVKTAYLHLK